MHASHLALRIRDEWKNRHPDGPSLRMAAAGASHLRDAGVEIWEDTTYWGAMGIIEGLKILPALLSARGRMVRRIRTERPDLVVPVDYRSFNMSLLKNIRIRPDGTKQKIAYYISPILWMTPQKNVERKALDNAVKIAKKMPGGRGARDRFEALADLTDLSLVAYPFSLDAYEKAGVNYRYIGHPLGAIAVEGVKKGRYLEKYRDAVEGKRLVCIAPGSRLHELRFHMPILNELLTLLKQRYRDLWFYCPVPSPKLEKVIRDGFGEHSKTIEFVPDDCYDLMEASDLLIVKSGTSVQLAMILAVPAVTFYKIGTDWLVNIGRKFFQELPHYAFPNLLAGREVVRELMQENFTLPNIYVACTELLDDPVQAGHMRAELAELRKATMKDDPIGEAAGLMCDLIEN